MQVECKENFEIKNYTTFKVGGVVSKIYLPKNQQELVFLLREIVNNFLIIF